MFGRWKPYVPVAQRRKDAEKSVAKLVKKGLKVTPIKLEGRTIARTFWGKAWCDHLESLSDYENRLPRGRTYVRNGSVIHLAIDSGKIEALVQGSSLYDVKIDIQTVSDTKWQAISQNCSGQIGSMIELLQGKLSTGVMQTITDRKEGLFPLAKEISLACSCPDWAGMCKHVAAVLYGVGARLDDQPELLFKLRKVDHTELIGKVSLRMPVKGSGKGKVIEDQDLSSLFGIDIASEAPTPIVAKNAEKKAATKKVAAKKKAAAKVKAKKVVAKKTTKAKAKKVTVTKVPVKKTAAKKKRG